MTGTETLRGSPQRTTTAGPSDSPDSSTALLTVEDLSVSYTSRGVQRAAVKHVSFTLNRGETLAVVGESGSGKSTIAQSLIGLLPPGGSVTGGTAHLGDPAAAVDLLRLSNDSMRPIRGRRIGLIPQDPSNSLNPVRTAGWSVAEAMHIHRRGDKHTRRRRTLELLERVGIDDPERRARQYPHELSGGQRQRVLIAAAIALEPELIIADEPTSALDVTVQRVILDLIDELRTELDAAVLFITHDLAVAAERADSLLVVHDGVVKERGPAHSVLSAPKDEYTQRLLANAPSLVSAPQRRPMPTQDPGFVRVEGITHRFDSGKSTFAAVQDVSFSVARGSTHALVGESGSGKTTLGRTVAGFHAPSQGRVVIDGVDVASSRRRREFRKQVQLVYQNPYGSLDPRQNVTEIIAEPLRNFGIKDPSQRRRRALAELDRVALPHGAADRLPSELSGGQRQRVAIARALVLRPDLLVLDEAVSALDVTIQAQILTLLERLQQELGLTYIFISHDLAVVRQIADTVSVLAAGEQVESGSTETVFNFPQHEYTRALLSAIPRPQNRAGSFLTPS